MIQKMGYTWRLRQLMANAGMFHTSDLQPKLAERGVHLSREQIYRLVTHPPQRLSMDVLAALCDFLDCTPSDLIEIQVVDRSLAKTARKGGSGDQPRVRRTTIKRPR